MRITIEPTEKLTTYNGAPARLWKGTTDGGIEVHVFVTGLAVPLTADASAFERELRETAPPTELRNGSRIIDLRQVL